MQITDYLTDATVVFFFANSLYVVSYMLTSMFWLRLLAVIAAASTFPYFYFQAEPLWSALFWQSCFLVVNLVNLLVLLYSIRSVQFDEDEGLAYGVRFSDLKPHEVRPIFKYAQRMTVPAGEILLRDGEANDSLYLILEGSFQVLKNGAKVAELGQGHLVGELSFISGEAISADVIAATDCRLMHWSKHGLAPLFRRQGLYESYFNSVCSLDVAGKLRTMTEGHAA